MSIVCIVLGLEVNVRQFKLQIKEWKTNVVYKQNVIGYNDFKGLMSFRCFEEWKGSMSLLYH